MEITKQAIIEVAKQEKVTELELISLLQASAAKTGDEKTLEALCDLKWEFIG
jgi:hypothetical protein